MDSLFQLCEQGKGTEVVKLLAEKTAASTEADRFEQMVNIIDQRSGLTPLLACLNSGHFGIALDLLVAGGSPQLTTRSAAGSLHLAALVCHSDASSYHAQFAKRAMTVSLQGSTGGQRLIHTLTRGAAWGKKKAKGRASKAFTALRGSKDAVEDDIAPNYLSSDDSVCRHLGMYLDLDAATAVERGARLHDRYQVYMEQGQGKPLHVETDPLLSNEVQLTQVKQGKKRKSSNSLEDSGLSKILTEFEKSHPIGKHLVDAVVNKQPVADGWAVPISELKEWLEKKLTGKKVSGPLLAGALDVHPQWMKALVSFGGSDKRRCWVHIVD